jgi:hypothetical protein
LGTVLSIAKNSLLCNSFRVFDHSFFLAKYPYLASSKLAIVFTKSPVTLFIVKLVERGVEVKYKIFLLWSTTLKSQTRSVKLIFKIENSQDVEKETLNIRRGD